MNEHKKEVGREERSLSLFPRTDQTAGNPERTFEVPTRPLANQELPQLLIQKGMFCQESCVDVTQKEFE